MDHMDDIDISNPDFVDLYDELPLWSAPFALMLLERVPVRPGLTYLDVGAGTGFLSIELAERGGPGTAVIAVDPWGPALDRLRRKAAQRELKNMRVLQVEAAVMDLPESSVDVIVSNLGINNFDDPDAVLRSCHRVARRGATLMLTTNLVGHMAEFYEAYCSVLAELGQRDRLEVLEAHVQHRGTVDSVGELLRGSGFRVRDVATDSFHLRFSGGAALLRHFFIRLGFLPGWKAVADPGALRETFDRLERRLDDVARQRGELALTVPMACFTAEKPA